MMQRCLVYLALIALLFGSEIIHAESHLDVVDAHLASMTLEQKVGQLFMVGLYGSNITEIGQQFLTTYQPGGVVVFAYNAGSPESITRLTNDWQHTITTAGAPPLLIAVDQEGGRINTLEEPPFTQFPVPALITAAANHNLAYQAGVAQSQELLAVGIHMNLAPVADLETNPNNPVIFRRSFGSDPLVVAPTLSAVIQGMQDAGVMATLKHFPGHGDTSSDSHVELPVIPYNREALDALELIPFQAGINAGVEAVMIGHLYLPEIEPLPNLPASLSATVIRDILRNDMGFEGIIMTDALDMDPIDTVYPLPLASVMAIQAGVDMLAMGPHIGMTAMEASITAIVDAVNNGDLTESRIDASVRRILSAKARYGLLNWKPLDPETASERVAEANGATVVNSLFEAGVTLVYDQESVLPLPRSERVGLVYPYHRPDVMRACLAENPNLKLTGFSNYPTPSEIQAAAQFAYDVDTLIVFTQNADRKPEQVALVNALPAERTVVVAYWSPYDLNAFNRRPAAYLTTYTPLESGFVTACRVLFGQAQARGRLPINLSSDLLAASGTTWQLR